MCLVTMLMRALIDEASELRVATELAAIELALEVLWLSEMEIVT